MSQKSESYCPSERPVPATPSQLDNLRQFLPSGATVIGAIVSSTKQETDFPDCFIVIYAGDDHTIHRAEMCQTGPQDYEITSDTVIGTW